MRLLMFATVLFVGCYVQNQPTGEDKLLDGDYSQPRDDDVGLFIGMIQAVNVKDMSDKQMFRVRIGYNRADREFEVKVGTGDTWDSTDCYTKFVYDEPSKSRYFGKGLEREFDMSARVGQNDFDVKVRFATYNEVENHALQPYDTEDDYEFDKYTGFDNRDGENVLREIVITNPDDSAYRFYRGSKDFDKYVNPRSVIEGGTPLKKWEEYFKDPEKDCVEVLKKSSSSDGWIPIRRPTQRP